MNNHYQLRYYQVEVIYKIQQLLDLGYSKFSLFLPKRLGKTVIEIGLINKLFQSNKIQSAAIICKNQNIKDQIKAIYTNFLITSPTISFDVFSQYEIRKQCDVLLQEKDLIILDDASASVRDLISKLNGISKKISISVSEGPYKYEEENKNVDNQKAFVSIVKAKSENTINIPPGLYLFPTRKLIDIRDIITSSPEELAYIQNTINQNLDFFIPLKQFILDGFVEYKFNQSDIINKINKLEERKKRIQELLDKEDSIDD